MTRVLVIDDQKIPRVAVGSILTGAGYQVAAEPGGAEGLARAREWHPDVIVLDVQMPDMDGFEVVERLKHDPLTAPVPVIFLTAEPPRDELVVRGLALGAYDFLNKGCSRAELLARVGAMARIKRGYDEMAALVRLSEIVVGGQDPAAMAELVAAEVARTFRAAAAVLVVPGDDNAAELRGVVGEPEGCVRLTGLAEARLREDGAPGAGADDCGPGGVACFARAPRSAGRPLLLGVLAPEDGAGGQATSGGPLLDLLARHASVALDAAALHQQAQAQAATLREQALALAQAMDERSRFFASMSHELRTPINAILGYTNLLRDGIYGEVRAEQAGALERVVVSGAHLLDIVNDVLDISKIDAGRLEISPAPADLGMLLREAVSSVEVQARAKGLEVVVEVPEGLELVTDAGRVTQILLNLLSNAVKFTDTGCISARLACADGWAEARVGDTGPGIPAEDHERVFSEFEQTETAVGRGGTGLGLAISRRLAILLGGTLDVESGPGPGSTFVLRLPAGGDGQLVAEAAPADTAVEETSAG